MNKQEQQQQQQYHLQDQDLANQNLKLCSCQQITSQENFTGSCPENTILSRYGDRNSVGDNVDGYPFCCKLCTEVSDEKMVKEEEEFQLNNCEIQR